MGDDQCACQGLTGNAMLPGINSTAVHYKKQIGRFYPNGNKSSFCRT